MKLHSKDWRLMKKKESKVEKSNREKKEIKVNKSVVKIQKLLRNTTKFNISETGAFKKNILQITITPERIASTIASDIDAYIARTFLLAKQRFNQYKNYKIYAVCELTFLDKDKKPLVSTHAKSSTHDSSKLNEFFQRFYEENF